MRITGDGIWGEPRDHDEVIRVLRGALELGINFIHTALAWLLWRPPVMLPIPGTSQVTHLEEMWLPPTIEVDGKELQGLDRTA